MKKLLCKFLGHKPFFDRDKQKAYCSRCGREGFYQRIQKKYGAVIEYGVNEE